MPNQNRKQSVLVADDDSFIREFIRNAVSGFDFQVAEAQDGSEAINLLDPALDIILLDLQMPKASGLEVLSVARSKCPDVPVIVISGTGEVSDAVAALKHGASDYISKPFAAEEIQARIHEVLKRHSLEIENKELRSTFLPARQIELIAGSSVGSSLIDHAQKAAQVDSTVLITGSSGTGKSALAQWIHQQGPRSAFPFVCVSCGAIPRELIESELFGHQKGAFTGADSDRVGRFESANGGTLFLDEIGELPIDLQPKLLNVLQDRIVTRVGSSESRPFDVRVIAATNRDLSVAVEEGRFREDLFYRINVLHLPVPTLSERSDDIPGLVEQKLKNISQRLKIGNINVSDNAMDQLLTYSWPGNIRELENILERAIVFAEDGKIEPRDLNLQSRNTSSGSEPSLLGLTLADIERMAIQQTLDSVNGKRAEAAEILGVSERTIYNRLREYEETNELD
ncbi:MAG: sigma-54 dependent transcriptional regulator [Phycisphaerales bacterium]|nr:sigma-54 dependent transcriptional regulator [Phycisphaerales bacterium]